MRPVRRFAAAVLAALTASALISCAQNDGRYVLHYTTYSSPTSDQSRTVQRWAEEVEELTDGGVQIKFHYSQSLVGADESVQATLDGRADLAQVGSLYAASDLAMYTVIELPFETKNPEVQMTAIERLYDENNTYRDDFDRQGVQLLFPLPLGIAVVGLKEPAAAPDDLAGRSIRSGGLTSEALLTVGANPV
ncbi:MAG: extracellular solute-binding protein, partial [Mycobacterium sp.]|nr:extracellular solute-binding protein [Mycobacterium sp.]